MTTLRPVTVCVASTFGIGMVTFADADDGPTTSRPMPAPVGTVSTEPVVGAVRVMTAPPCPGALTAKAVMFLLWLPAGECVAWNRELDDRQCALVVLDLLQRDASQ